MAKEIVFMSRSFYPETGGIAEFGNILVNGLKRRGYNVTVITNTKLKTDDATDKSRDFQILRRGKAIDIAKIIERADLVILSHFSMRNFIYPYILRKRRIIITHNAIQCDGHKINLKEWIKNQIIARNINVCVSETLARYYPKETLVIRNGVNLPLKVPSEKNLELRDIIFVGRAIPNKGVYTLLKAISAYEKIFQEVLEVTIVCDFKRLPHADALLNALKIKSKLYLISSVENTIARELMTHHRFVVVPTITEEPFGLVAVEGLLSGCVPIVSKVGGLSEATMGKCISFQNGDFLKLAQIFRESKQDYINIRKNIIDKLDVEMLSSERMIDQYESLISKVTN